MGDQPPVPGASSLPGLLAGKRVLLAEDSYSQQRLLSYLLEKAGSIVTPTKNGQEVIERAAQESFDAVLLDMQMPQVDGYEAARQLRLQGYRGPIIALTADNFSGDEQRCLQAGCDAYLAKPVQPAEMFGVLLRYLAASTAPPLPPPSPREAYKDLLLLYTSGLKERIQKLREALAARDRAMLKQLAHKFRGSAAMYGFMELAETVQLLEDALREGQNDGLLQELIDEMGAMVQEIVQR